MKNLVVTLMNQSPVATHIQFAENSDWENCSRHDLQQSEVHLPAEGKNVGNTIAFEIFYLLEDRTAVMFGVRYSPDMKPVEGPTDFVSKVLRVASDADSMNLMEVMKRLGVQCYGDEDRYLAASIDFCELGVVDFWKSEGTTIVRRVEEEPISEGDLTEKLSSNEQLLTNKKNPIMLDLATSDPECWIACQVSDPQLGKHVTNLERVLQLANSF